MKPLQALLTLFALAFLPLHAASLDDLTYTTNNGEVAITDCNTAATGELVIPDTIEGNPVTSIGSDAFEDCTSLTSITIPDSVPSIANYAFDDCTGLTSITIPDSVTSIGVGAFWSCESLTSITIPDSVRSIGDEAFRGCSSLTTIEVGAGNVNFTTINGVLFNKEKTVLHTYPAGKTGDNYTIPDGVTSIGERAFNGCTSLTSITIPEGVISIGAGAFYECTSLTSITIPDGVTSIGDIAFYNCTSLTSITIPDGVTSIGSDAFRDCTSLTSITIPDSVTSIGFGCFDSSPITNLEIPSRFSLALTYLGISPRLSYQKLMEFTASNNEATADETLEAFSQKLDVLNENDQFIGEQMTILGENDQFIGEQMTILGENDQSISEQMATLSQNDETIMTEINAMKAQLQTLVDAVAQKDAEISEKDAEIAKLKQGGEGQTLEQVLEQVQDARLGSVILNPDAEGNMTLKLEIEESSDLSVWENNGESVEVELPLTEGKKFLRFALK